MRDVAVGRAVGLRWARWVAAVTLASAAVLFGAAAALEGGVDAAPAGGAALPPAALTARAGAAGPSGVTAAVAATTVTLADGTTFGPGVAHEALVGPPGPWVGWDADRGVAAWPELLRPRVTLVVPGERFVEEAYVAATPAPCYAFHRTVTDLDVGIDGPVGARIAAELLTWLEPPYFAGEVASDDDPRCRDRPRAAYGFAVEEVGRVACAVPDGPELRCFLVAQWAWHLGDVDVRRVAHLVFERATGTLLDGEALHPGVDPAAVDARVSALVCAAGGRCAPLVLGPGQVHPTRSGLVVDLAPGEAADAALGTRRLVVPWGTLPG